MCDTGPDLERLPPVVLYTILQAVRRFEPDLYAHICRTHHLDADRIFGLFTNIEDAGVGQLPDILHTLRSHQAYHDIMFLAGRNALLLWAEEHNISFGGLNPPPARLLSFLKQHFPVFLGLGNYNLMARGSVQFIEVRNSLFARNVDHPEPVCGFYTGIFAQVAQELTHKTPVVQEVRCLAADPDASSCMFQVAL
jgi:hypothetical protein